MSFTFQVTSQTNVSRVRISKRGGDSNKVEIIIRRRGQFTASGPEDIFLQGSSGMQENSSFRGYDEISFPFSGNVSFDYTKQANDSTDSTAGAVESLATSVRAAVNFIIKEPVHWRINNYY